MGRKSGKHLANLWCYMKSELCHGKTSPTALQMKSFIIKTYGDHYYTPHQRRVTADAGGGERRKMESARLRPLRALSHDVAQCVCVLIALRVTPDWRQVLHSVNELCKLPIYISTEISSNANYCQGVYS